MRFTFFLLVLLFSVSWSNDVLKSLPQNSWYSASNTKMVDVCPPRDSFPMIQASGGCKTVTETWSGGALDHETKNFYIWGGGHGDYYGNELYAFNTETMKWKRVTDPSPVPTLSVDPMDDGKPASRHTYDGLSFISSQSVLFAYGGSKGGNGYATYVTWTFDPKTLTWKDMNPLNSEVRPMIACCNLSSAYDPIGKIVWVRDPSHLFFYDPEKNSWNRLSEWYHVWGPRKTVVDTKRRLLFTAGSGKLFVYDILNSKDVSSEWETAGADDFINGYGVGMEYDSYSDRLVGYLNGDIYILDLVSKKWSRGLSVNLPISPIQNGTFGRFRYIQDDDVFVLVNRIYEDVYFYKPPKHSVSIKSSKYSVKKQDMLRKVFINGRKKDG